MPATRSTLITTITYRDRRAAIAWLEKAFGFETVMLLEEPSGEIAHCEMKLGDGAISVGSEWAEPYRSPASIGGWCTQNLHVHIDEGIDAHCERARALGAVITAEPETQFYGDRSYRCRDLEGHMWTISQTVETVSREQAEAASGLKITGWAM